MRGVRCGGPAYDFVFIPAAILFLGEIGLTYSTSLSVAQPSGTNKGNVEEISSQGEVLKRKRQPKGKKVVQAKQAKPKNGKQNPKAHEATENIPAESTSCDDGVSLTENVFATQTENESFFAREDGGLITDVVAEESSGFIGNEPSCGLSAGSASIENVVAGTKVSQVKRIIESSSDSESEMKGQSSIQATYTFHP
ncbi:hypothetical protein DAPPUDRAFT_330347 [Daphnia pulex]|uniref:Uncharacterized protein n=1 Tax=Daphnia pulex TaxID=6669 RepID=E9HJA8_DAPPU|nr:hypothetical protein DAPPUDRAFT_330347 [Daphnia pulex]|eukprot:EFX68178.1 hypothetical protein DAPPUDRAFT_330347 [Daphnia pulex]